MIPYRHMAIIWLTGGTLALFRCSGSMHSARQAAEVTGNPDMHRVVDTYAGDPEKLAADG